MQKLIFDCRMFHNSGIGRYIQEVLPRIKNHFDITCLIKKDAVHFFKNKYQHRIFENDIYTIKEQINYRNYCNDSTAIFWSPHYNVPLLNIKPKLRICTIHDAYHLAHGGEFSPLKRMYAKKVMKAAIEKSDIIFTVSEFSKSEILKYYPQAVDKINVVYNGLPSLFKKANIDKSMVFSKYGINKKYILFVGNVKPNKNLSTLIKALEILILEKKINEIKLVIVGKKDGFITNDNSVISTAYISLKDNITFTGQVSDEELQILYTNAEVFCFPSIYEGFGLPVLEAMSLGCPVICSDASSLPEVCASAALFFNPFSAEDIADKIYMLWNNEKLRKNLIHKGTLRVLDFNWDYLVNKKVDIIKNFER